MRNPKKMSYSEYWNQFGEYGKERVKRMIARKQARHYRRLASMETRLEYRYIDGVLHQKCDYQPSFSCVSWCEVPCNGDC